MEVAGNLTKRQKKQEEEKLPFVQFVREKKELLFGNFDDSKGITKAAKRDAWVENSQKLVALGINLIPEGKDWNYCICAMWCGKTYKIQLKTSDSRQQSTQPHTKGNLEPVSS